MVPLLVTESTPDACVVVFSRENSSEGLRLMVAFHLSLCVLSAPSAVMPVAVEVAGRTAFNGGLDRHGILRLVGRPRWYRRREALTRSMPSVPRRPEGVRDRVRS
jgi:hypothetical protein